MRVSGEATLHASPDQVWEALTDPALLARAMPGCERLEATGPGACSLVVTAGVASTKGTYAGSVAMHDAHRPDSFLLSASVAGEPGTMRSEIAVHLTDLGDGSTRLRYDGDAGVGGTLAGVGQRMLAAAVSKTAGEFFCAVDGLLAERADRAATPAPTAGEPRAPEAVGTAQSTRAWRGRRFVQGAVVAATAVAGVSLGRLLERRRYHR